MNRLEAVDGDIERVEKAPAGGRIGAEAGGLGGEQGVQRIDADEVGARLGGQLGEAGEILEVADAPIAVGAQAVKLAGDAPGAMAVEPAGQMAARLEGREAAADFLIRAGGHAEGGEHAALGVLAWEALLAGLGDVGKGDAMGFGETVQLRRHSRATPGLAGEPARAHRRECAVSAYGRKRRLCHISRNLREIRLRGVIHCVPRTTSRSAPAI
jgi:hypothetical protein